MSLAFRGDLLSCRIDQLVTIRILVTGSRHWADPDRIRRELERATADIDADSPILVHGGCPTGADRQAELAWLAMGHDGSTVDRHPADRSLGNRGFYLRNQAMVDLHPAVCLAFIGACEKPGCQRAPHPHPSHGTQMTIDLCGKAAVPVRLFYSDVLERAGHRSTLWLTRQQEKLNASPGRRPLMTGAETTRPWPIRPARPAGA